MQQNEGSIILSTTSDKVESIIARVEEKGGVAEMLSREEVFAYKGCRDLSKGLAMLRIWRPPNVSIEDIIGRSIKRVI
ncbi:MAG: hypothetical protein WC420_01270 [Candidatus Paceibacterota bacterium]|jgi:hypothetical protein